MILASNDIINCQENGRRNQRINKKQFETDECFCYFSILLKLIQWWNSSSLLAPAFHAFRFALLLDEITYRNIITFQFLFNLLVFVFVCLSANRKRGNAISSNKVPMKYWKEMENKESMMKQVHSNKMQIRNLNLSCEGVFHVRDGSSTTQLWWQGSFLLFFYETLLSVILYVWLKFFSRISHCKYGLILIQCADDFTLHFLLFLLIWLELTFFMRSFSFSDFDEITFDQICY